MNVDKGLYTGVVLLDLQKAFDTVNHDILLRKLKSIECGEAVNWFSSTYKMLMVIGSVWSSFHYV